MSATEPTTDLTLDVERFLQMLAAGTFVDEPPIVAPADALEILFSSQIDNDNGQRDMYLDILGFGFNYLINPNKRLRVSTMHRNLAKKYQENGRENETDKDVLDGLLKDEDEKAKGNEKFLAYLLAHGTQGFNILNVILNPATYEAADFHLDTVKPLIRFLLHIHPALLGGSTTYKISQPPIFTALQIKATAYTRNNGCDPPMTFEPSVKQDIISFLCDTRNDGLGSTEAIKSLAQMVSNTTGSCNAIHRIIESADFDISETLLRELSRITTSDVHGHTETCCLETLDSQGRTCLHIALTAPVNERKIWWAEMLAKRFPDLLKACTYTSTTKKHSSTGKRLTPLQHFMEQKMKTISEMSTDEDDLKLFFQLEKLEFF
ncbi:hypothetical protein TrVFT333_004891 [Trichoderma virens FT-333]|nr:hypothetical protein TrVFT333_004891 [Trichoderma virens FT-333]